MGVRFGGQVSTFRAYIGRGGARAGLNVEPV